MHHRLRFVISSLLLAALLAFGGSVLAGPTIRAQLSGAARKDWDAARELFEAGNFRAARVQFERVHEQSGNPRVLFNVGVCWKNLERYAKALSTWEKELTQREKLSADERRRVEQAIETVRPFVSNLMVETSPPGARVSVGGAQVGRTPMLAPAPIDVGVRTVVIEKPGFIRIERKVEVARGQPAKLRVKLEPVRKTAAVRVGVTGAPKARIFIDGTEMGLAPFSGQVAVGRHTFEARASGFVTARQTSVVKYRAPLEIELELVVAHAEGKVKIVTGFEDAAISVDGKAVGHGAWDGVLPAGGHRLEVRKDGYQTYSGDFALSDGQERRLRIELRPARGSAWIWWTAASVAVVAGAGVASYFVLRPAESSEVTGTLQPGVVPTGLRF